MKIPYSWLTDLLPELPAKLDDDPHKLEPVMAMLGTGIEEVIEFPAPADGVVFGVVLECAPIPDTHLFALSVDVGDGTPKPIVTGAPNSRAGIGVAVSKPGTVIQGVTLGVRTVQGRESWGMVCSPKELEVGDYGGGLLELPVNEAAPGTALSSIWPADHVLDVEVTPNRADALSVLGVARDIAAYLRLELRLPSKGLESQSDPSFPVKVSLDPKRDADRFIARMIRGTKVGPSPAWLQRRVTLAGMRAINNVVDASNYVMLEIGQPTAAYDARDLPNLELQVRDAKPGEKLVGLNDFEYECDERDLLVATTVNGESLPVGLGGILGARYSSIRESTTDVIIEAAHWNPVRLRLTGRRLGLTTDALYHFERGVDPNIGAWAADRFLEIVRDSGGGQVVPGHADAGDEKPRVTVEFRPWYANEFLGTDYRADDMQAALERLGFIVRIPESVSGMGKPTIARLNASAEGMAERLERGVPVSEEDPALEFMKRESTWTVLSPTWRVNMDLEEDIIEEVARILGYDAIPETVTNVRVNDETRNVDGPVRATRALKDVLVGLGFQEIVSYTFTNADEASRAHVPEPVLELANPISSERTHLRTQLLSSLLATAQVNRALESLMLFEVGHVFPYPKADTDHPGEEHLGLLMSGAFAPNTWMDGIAGGFYAFKGLLEATAAKLGDTFEVRPLAEMRPFLHPGIAGEVVWNGVGVGVIGAVHPQVLETLELPANTLVAEVKLPLPSRAWAFADPSRQPAALRDLAVIAPKAVPYARLLEITRDAGGSHLENVEPFDVFSGGRIPEGSRSVAMRLTFRAQDRTLTDEETNAALAQVIEAIKHQGFEVRAR